MGLSDEGPDLVSNYIDEMGLTLRIGSGSTSSGKYGVSGIPSSCLIGPDGKVVWAGHPSSLSDATIKEALKGVKPRSLNFLALVPSKQLAGRLAAVGKSMEAGKLGKALADAKVVAADAKANEVDKADAQTALGEIEAHVAVLSTQAEGFVKNLDVVKALLVFDTLAKEFGNGELGTAAKKRADEVRKDPALAKELAAAEAFEKAREAAAKLGSSKARAKFQEVAEKYKGTKAGERAAAAARPKKE